MKQSQRIVKNSLSGIVAAGLGGALQVGTLLLIARSLPVAEFGQFSFIMAFGMFFLCVTDFGLTRILVREVATAKREEQAALMGGATALIRLLSAIACLVMVLTALCLPFPWEVRAAAVLMGLSTLTRFSFEGTSAMLRAREDNEIVHLGFTLHKIVLLGFVLVALRIEIGLPGLAGAYFMANLLLAAFYSGAVSRLYFRIRPKADAALWNSLIRASLPMGGGVMLRTLALQIDILILTWLTTLRTVGVFSGPYRFGTIGLQILAQTLAMPLYPVFSRLAAQPGDAFQEACRRTLKLFFLMAFPCATFAIIWPEVLVDRVLGPKFQETIPAIPLLGIGAIPFFVSTVFPYIFAALHQQRKLFASAGAATVIRVALATTLIPVWGGAGLYAAFLVSETALIGIWIVQLGRLGVSLAVPSMLWRPVLASLAMSVVLFAAGEQSLLLQIGSALLALAVYAGAVFSLGALTSEELRLAREGFRFGGPLKERWENAGRNR